MSVHDVVMTLSNGYVVGFQASRKRAKEICVYVCDGTGEPLDFLWIRPLEGGEDDKEIIAPAELPSLLFRITLREALENVEIPKVSVTANKMSFMAHLRLRNGISVCFASTTNPTEELVVHVGDDEGELSLDSLGLQKVAPEGKLPAEKIAYLLIKLSEWVK